MKRINLIASVLGLAFIAGLITSCAQNNVDSDVTYLHVYNWEDYIYQYDIYTNTWTKMMLE